MGSVHIAPSPKGVEHPVMANGLKVRLKVHIAPSPKGVEHMEKAGTYGVYLLSTSPRRQKALSTVKWLCKMRARQWVHIAPSPKGVEHHSEGRVLSMPAWSTSPRRQKALSTPCTQSLATLDSGPHRPVAKRR